ncbi:ParB/RepB/Spo0J family partition protein [Paenibacillus rhizoplanae]
METIPALVREFNDSQAASIALIENLQREGLTSIEEAIAYQKLIDLHQLTQESLAQRLGKKPIYHCQQNPLAEFARTGQDGINGKKKITERHARSLLSLDTEEMQHKVLAEIISKELNVKTNRSTYCLL